MTQPLADRKTAIRKAAHAARKAQADKAQGDKAQNGNAQGDKATASRRITDRLFALPEYQSANTVMWYINVREEARTRHALPDAIDSDKKIVVPYCVDGQLELFLLESMEELETGMYRILEPKELLRSIQRKHVHVADIDLIVIPGVAFDAVGGRVGHGKGYYDKLLSNAKPETILVALAFQCQMFDEVPMQDHDIYMDKVITEDAVYQGRGRQL